MQGRRKSLPMWVLASPGLLWGRLSSLTASRHNWDCRWTSWPLSWSSTQMQWVLPTFTVIQQGGKNLPLWTSTGDSRRLVCEWGKEIGPPSLPWRQNTKALWDSTVFRNRSWDRSAAVTKDHFSHGLWPDFFNKCVYLAASPAARGYVHDPTLQSLTPGVVCAAACACIVQLQRSKMGQVSLSCPSITMWVWVGACYTSPDSAGLSCGM